MSDSAPVPRRVQLRRVKGWRLPPGTVVVSRPTVFGNPFPADLDRVGAVDRYRRWLCGSLSPREWAEHASWTHRFGMVADRQAVLETLPALRGKDLACWCRLDQACHGDVLLELANRPEAS